MLTVEDRTNIFFPTAPSAFDHFNTTNLAVGLALSLYNEREQKNLGLPSYSLTAAMIYVSKPTNMQDQIKLALVRIKKINLKQMKVKYAKQNICEEWRKSSFVTPNFDLSSSDLGLFFITLKTRPFHFNLITFWLFIVLPSATGFIFNVVVFAFSSLNGLVKTCVLSFDVFSSSWEPWADAFGCFKVYVELRVDSAKTFEQFIPPHVIL